MRPLRRGPVERVGEDVLAELSGSAVFWAVDATPTAVRAALSPRLPTLVSPRPGDRPRRRGPAVALLVDDPRVAGEYLAALLPVPVVPMLVRGAFRTDEPTQVRFGAIVGPEPGEAGEDTVARVVAEIDRLHHEDSLGWWESLRAAGRPDATIPAAPAGGWRRQWDRTRPRPRPDQTIWSDPHPESAP